MPKHSAGILLYKKENGQFQVFLVHPGGPFWAKKDRHVWSIPKGLLEPGEDAWHAAIREFKEETGFEIHPVKPLALAPVKLKSGKIVNAWAVEGQVDAGRLKSNTFELEWPPHSGRLQAFPEIDKGAWFDCATAKEKINAQQAHFIDELRDKLSKKQSDD